MQKVLKMWGRPFIAVDFLALGFREQKMNDVAQFHLNTVLER